jgi:hypothetical protein
MEPILGTNLQLAKMSPTLEFLVPQQDQRAIDSQLLNLQGDTALWFPAIGL